MFASPVVDNIADTCNLWPINHFFFCARIHALNDCVLKKLFVAYLYIFVKIFRVYR